MSRTRKVALFATVAALASALVAAMAFAVTQQTFSNTVKVLGAKHGTPTKPRSVTFDTLITGKQSETGIGKNASASKHTVIRFSKYFKFNGQFFKTCTQAQATQQTCPSSALVGTGKAEARTASGQVLHFNVKAYNGPGGKKLELNVRGSDNGVNSTIEGTVKKDSGLYGYKLDVVIPQPLYEPVTNFFTPLTLFQTHITKTTKVKGRTRGYIENIGCPKNHKWPFQAQFTYANNGAGSGVESPSTVNYSAKCS